MKILYLVIGLLSYFGVYKVAVIHERSREHLSCACGHVKESHARKSFSQRSWCDKCDCLEYDPYRKTSG